MAIQATQIRKGMAIIFNGVPHKVVDFHHHTPGNLRAMVQTKLRNLKTGTTTEHRFRSADTIERAILEDHEIDFVYGAQGAKEAGEFALVYAATMGWLGPVAFAAGVTANYLYANS